MKGRKLFCLTALSACILSSYSANAFETDSIETFNIWHSEEVAEKGLALGELTLRERSKEDPVLVINDSKVLFNDSGRDGDKKEGDGIYSAFFAFNIKELIADKIKNIKNPEELDNKISELVKFPKFAGRLVSEDEELVKLLITAKESPNLYAKIAVLKKIEPELEKISIKELFDNIGFDSNVEPLLSIKPRTGRASLISLIGVPAPVFLQTVPNDIDPATTLMITNPEVIEDPSRTFNICRTGSAQGTAGGVWTFSYLMKKLSIGSGLTPEQYTLDWLSTWATNQTLSNGNVANSRATISSIKSEWLAESLRGGSSTYNLDYFPATLMAIVNRPDAGLGIRGGSGGYGSSRGEMKKGETRLVFALLSRSSSNYSRVSKRPPIGSNDDGDCQTIPFTVIFEYNNPVSSCEAIKSWQTRWQNLQFTSIYNQELAELTNEVVNNGSLLAHLRTNEIALATPWELREFVRSNLGQLRLDPLDATPIDNSNNTTLIPNCLASNPSCEAATSSAPIAWNSPSFGGNAFTRFSFALNTCNGCHTTETGTGFTHIGWSSNLAFPSSHEFDLSRFITGKNNVETLNFPSLYSSSDRFNPFAPPIIDPVTNQEVSFNDLARRQVAMANVLDAICRVRVETLTESLMPIDGTIFDSVH